MKRLLALFALVGIATTPLIGLADRADAEPDGTCFGAAVTVAGTNGPDVIVGTSGDDVIHGQDGNDKIDGKGGNDKICGGWNNDTINPGGGDDQVAGEDANTGGHGVDTLSYAGSSIAITANLVTKVATGQGTDTFVGIANLTGSSAGDTLRGDRSNNVFAGGPGNDAIDGVAAVDTVSFAGAANVITCNLTLGTSTGQGADTLANIDNIVGGTNNDVLTGNDGPNVITGNPGNDTIDGKAAGDTASFSPSPNPVNANLLTGIATGHGTDTLTNMDNLIGSAHDDTLIGNNGKNTITGGLGDDTIDGKGNLDTSNYVAAPNAIEATMSYPTTFVDGHGSDTLSFVENFTGSKFNDHFQLVGTPTVVRAGDGNDTINTGFDDDTIDPGPGNDTVSSGSGNDTVLASDGNDTLGAGIGTDTIDASSTNLAVTVDLGAGVASGSGLGVDSVSGFDVVISANGDDSLRGDNANNVFFPGFGTDQVLGGNGIDTISYASLDTPVAVNLAAGIATGAGTDSLFTIENATGGDDDDTLIGSAAINVLDGGPGTDTCTGGVGDTELNCEA